MYVGSGIAGFKWILRLTGWVKGGGVPFFVASGSVLFPQENLDFCMQNSAFWCNFRVNFIAIQTTFFQKKMFVNFLKMGLNSLWIFKRNPFLSEKISVVSKVIAFVLLLTCYLWLLPCVLWLFTFNSLLMTFALYILSLVYTEFILVRLCRKLLAYIETLSNPFLEPTSTEQWV